MNRYHVTFFYLATGMEGYAQREDLGVVEAPSQGEAINHVMKVHYNKLSQSSQDFVRGCLSAKLVGNHYVRD